MVTYFNNLLLQQFLKIGLTKEKLFIILKKFAKQAE